MSCKKILLVLSAALLFSGCATTGNDLEHAKEMNSPTDKIKDDNNEKPLSLLSLKDVVFDLISIDDVPPPVKNNQVSISFSYTNHFGDIIRGNAGCNNFFTTYSTQRSVLITGQMVSTDNHCPADQMQIEGFMFNIYSQKPILTFADDLLIMNTPNNVLTFKKQIKEKSPIESTPNK